MKSLHRRRLLGAAAFLAAGRGSLSAAPAIVNSIGMRLVHIEPGTFLMGQGEGGGPDERPVRRVTIRQPFRMGATEVTNAQYELFAPDHRRYRGMSGVSREDDEPVVFVSWRHAAAFCQWLSSREGKTYRLPTEAEWEYACRAGTSTLFWTGSELPEAHWRNQPAEGDWSKLLVRADDDLRKRKGMIPVLLRAGATPPNPWGLHEMHGGVEEWCNDWYGPYPEVSQTDPLGPADGMFRVCRGGSHNTYVRFLRSANRAAALPEDRHWLIGFRVVEAALPRAKPLPPQPVTMNDPSVIVRRAAWPAPPDRAFFAEPAPFVRPDQNDPRLAGLHHHHHPSLTWCENGDLLAIWYNTRSEIGREMTILSNRLRRGQTGWETARYFFKVPGRNMTGSCIFHDGKGRLYFLNGVSESSHHKDQALALAVSSDSGRTWSRPRIISNLDDRRRYSPMDSAFVARDGSLVVAVDTNSLRDEATGYTGWGTVFISRDQGRTWVDQSAGAPVPDVREGGSGRLTSGYHLSVVELRDGRLLAYSRTGDIGGRMTKNVSAGMGRTWTYTASEFPPVAGGQRLALLRLREGPLLFASFTDKQRTGGIPFTDAAGKTFTGYGLFAALSFDEGETWPVRRLLTTGGPARTMDGGGNTRKFVMDETHAELAGYLAVTQTPDGVIHLISSRWHYRFNLAWLKERPVLSPAG